MPAPAQLAGGDRPRLADLDEEERAERFGVLQHRCPSMGRDALRP